MAFSVEIPPPPSVNHAFSNVRGVGRVKTKVYRQWSDLAAKLIWMSVKASQRVAGPIIVHIDFPVSTRSDLDNLIKGTLDALVASGRIDDDRHVAELHVKRGRSTDTALILVEAHRSQASAAARGVGVKDFGTPTSRSTGPCEEALS